MEDRGVLAYGYFLLTRAASPAIPPLLGELHSVSMYVHTITK
jgi:hypothetical protein